MKLFHKQWRADLLDIKFDQFTQKSAFFDHAYFLVIIFF